MYGKFKGNLFDSPLAVDAIEEHFPIGDLDFYTEEGKHKYTEENKMYSHSIAHSIALQFITASLQQHR